MVDKVSLTTAQKSDKIIQNILDKLNANHKKIKKVFVHDKDVILFLIDKVTGNWRLVLPQIYREYALKACHDDFGGSHLGRIKIFDRLYHCACLYQLRYCTLGHWI